jgi:hypothetical protein
MMAMTAIRTIARTMISPFGNCGRLAEFARLGKA